MAISRELISRFDKAQEDRVLTEHESQLRKQLKISHLGLASLDRTIACQRPHIANLKDGDANRNFNITADNQVLTDHDEMAEATFSHFDALLGTAVAREHTLDFSFLIEAQDLQELDMPFGIDEVCNAIKRLHA
jgi:hypothetical protein